MTHLIVLVHADPSIAERYEKALGIVGNVEFRLANNFVAGKLSAAYVELFGMVRNHSGGAVDGLLARIGARQRSEYETLTIATFSAGYALARGLLSIPSEADKIDAIVGIDSWHTGLDADHTANESQLAGLVAKALRAVEGNGIVWFGHTDVATPQVGPGAYASTTQVALELIRLVGQPANGWRCKSYNTTTNQPQEHRNALCQWGPVWLADAVLELVAQKSRTKSPVAQYNLDTSPLGVRAVTKAYEELCRNVREIPGPRHNPRILSYFAGCERDGKPLKLAADEFAWCAAFASWCAFTSAMAGEFVPHKWRASVRELWLDAVSCGAAVARNRICSHEVAMTPGDLWVGVRGGAAPAAGKDPFAATEGKGHVARIETVAEYSCVTIDGNHDNTVARVHRKLDAPEWVGIIRYPRPDAKRSWSEAELEVARRLIALSDSVMRGEGG